MNPQPTQGDKKDTINPNVELENVESNVGDSAALAIDALEDELRAVQRISAVIQILISYTALNERETLKKLEERCAELIKVIENVRLQMESILEQNFAAFQDMRSFRERQMETIRRLEELKAELMEIRKDRLKKESILKQNEADQAELDKESKEIINMNIKPPHALDGNFNEELSKKSGQESSIVTVTESDLETNNERDDEPIDEPQPDANNMIDNNVGGAETENEMASDIKQVTEEQLEAGKQQFAAEEKLSKSGSTALIQEE